MLKTAGVVEVLGVPVGGRPSGWFQVSIRTGAPGQTRLGWPQSMPARIRLVRSRARARSPPAAPAAPGPCALTVASGPCALTVAHGPAGARGVERSERGPGAGRRYLFYLIYDLSPARLGRGGRRVALTAAVHGIRV